MYKSKIELSQEDYWNNVEVVCELCNHKQPATNLSTCDRCGRFVCSDCSEAVCNRQDNPYSYDFLCNACKEELDSVEFNMEEK